VIHGPPLRSAFLDPDLVGAFPDSALVGFALAVLARRRTVSALLLVIGVVLHGLAPPCLDRMAGGPWRDQIVLV
jgi:hypothetical protein